MREKTTTLARDERLSQSVLWEFMRTFYDGHGLDAWRCADPVPHYVTTSPALVQAYARIIEGFLQDCASSPDFDPSQPVYIVELGAGHGRLGYRLATRLLRILEGSALGSLRWVYVLSDLSERNIASWEAQPQLRLLLDAGVLDFARFDIGHDESITLAHAGTVLAPATVVNPLVVIANYVFDSLPHDAFYVHDGALFERKVTLTTTHPDPDIADPALLAVVDVSCAHHPASADYYDVAAWNEVLAEYRDKLPEAAVLFPVGALECIRHLEALCRNGMLLLASDKGWTDEQLLVGAPEPLDFQVHAGRCFSMMVNFHAIARYVARRHGAAFFPRRKAVSLVVAAFLLGENLTGYAETGRRYAEAVDSFGPDDFYTMMRGVSATWAQMAPHEIAAFLQLAGGDDFVLASCMPVLLDVASTLADHEKRQFRAVVRETWDAYLPIGEEGDRAFQYGTLLYELGFYADALELFERSATSHGRRASTVYNIGACRFALQSLDEARAAVAEALELDSRHEAARALLLAIDAGLPT